MEKDCLICWFNLLKWIKFDYVKFAKQMTLHVPCSVFLKTRCHKQRIISLPMSTSSIVFSFNTLAVFWFLAISLLQGKKETATNLFMFSHYHFFHERDFFSASRINHTQPSFLNSLWRRAEARIVSFVIFCTVVIWLSLNRFLRNSHVSLENKPFIQILNIAGLLTAPDRRFSGPIK